MRYDGNILTFNPGWSGPHQEMDEFTDVRKLAEQLEKLQPRCHAEAIRLDPDWGEPHFFAGVMSFTAERGRTG